MPTVTKPYGDFVNNVDVADANKVNAQINGVYNAINGGLDSANVPTLGDVTTLTTVAKGSVVAAINEIAGYPINSVTRQSLINGGFSVNQRSVSGTVTLTAGQYGHDRWKAGAGGCTYTFATSNNVTTITITAGSLIQVIEGINLYSGNYTLSWSGTAQGRIGAGAYGASGATSAITGGTNTSIEFNAGTLSNVQFNIGNVKLPFQPRSFGDELALCLRYYYKSFDNTQGVVGNVLSIASSSAILSPSIKFPVQMRVAPTILLSNNGISNQVRNTNSSATITLAGLALPSNSKGIGYISFTSNGSIVAGQSYDYDITADAEL